MTPAEYKEVQGKIAAIERDIARTEGRNEEHKRTLQKAGANSLSEAKALLKKLRKKHDAKYAKLVKRGEQFVADYGDLLDGC